MSPGALTQCVLGSEQWIQVKKSIEKASMDASLASFHSEKMRKIGLLHNHYTGVQYNYTFLMTKKETQRKPYRRSRGCKSIFQS